MAEEIRPDLILILARPPGSILIDLRADKKNQGPTEIRTRITGFRVLGANHYTMGPLCPSTDFRMVF